MILHINNIDQIPRDKKVVIDFFAPWCKPCIVIAPEFERLSNQYNNIVFLKVNMGESPNIADEYDVAAMPTFIFLNNGNYMNSTVGADIDSLTYNLIRLEKLI
jgi:thioredoxin 1